MSHPSQSHSKKRKQAAVTEAGGEAAQPALKKAKHSSEKKLKDNSKAGPLTGHGTGSGSKGEFQTITSTLNVSIPPIYAMEPRRGVQEMLDGMLMRYVPALRGVLVAHTNVKFLGTVATIKADCPFANCRVSFDATVWSPQIGMKLSGKVNLCSPDHVSLLIHNVFNTSIPRHHIPSESWEFEYGPAENDPEVAVEGQNSKDGDMKMAEGTEQTSQEPDHPEVSTSSGGRWVHNLTGDMIGGKSGYAEFTVIGLTIANQMLSVIGSIQPDPFSPEHVPKRTAPATPESEEAAEVLNQLMTEPAVADDLEEDSDEEDDAFRRLGKMADEAKRAELKVREEAEAAAAADKAAKKDKKKKDKKRSAEKSIIREKQAKKAKRKKVE